MEAGESITEYELCESYSRECFDGPIEYKLKLVGKSEERIDKLATQMNYRLTEGNGEALYCLGVADDGRALGLCQDDLKESLATLKRIATVLESASNFCIMVGPVNFKRGTQGLIAEVHVGRRPQSHKENSPNVRICCLGNVNAGKSTLVGVLLRGSLDNGHGLVRTEVFRYAHELEAGHTTSITRHLVEFDEAGHVRPPSDKIGVFETQERKGNTVTLIDLAGHTSYLKTTMFGLTSQCPDYTLVAVAADAIRTSPPMTIYCSFVLCAELATQECLICTHSWCETCFCLHICICPNTNSTISSMPGRRRSSSATIRKRTGSSWSSGSSAPSPSSSSRSSSPFAFSRVPGSPLTVHLNSSSPTSSSSCFLTLAATDITSLGPPPLVRSSSLRKSSSSPSLYSLTSPKSVSSSPLSSASSSSSTSCSSLSAPPPSSSSSSSASAASAPSCPSFASASFSSVKAHVDLSRSLAIPTFVVVTRTDVPKNEDELIRVLVQVRRDLGAESKIISTMEEAISCAKPTLDCIPIFHISSVTGRNLPLLRTFLRHLTKSVFWQTQGFQETEFDIDETYWIEGVGPVVSGTVMMGHLRLQDLMYLGPDQNGGFRKVQITSLHFNGVPIKAAHAGQAAAVALANVQQPSDLRRGMALVTASKQLAVKGIEAEVWLMGLRSAVNRGHESVIYCATTRQAARIESIYEGKASLRVGEKAVVRFIFCYHPEYVRVGSKLVFTDGQFRGTGTVVGLVPFDPDVDVNVFQRKRRTRTSSENDSSHGQ